MRAFGSPPAQGAPRKAAPNRAASEGALRALEAARMRPACDIEGDPPAGYDAASPRRSSPRLRGFKWG